MKEMAERDLVRQLDQAVDAMLSNAGPAPAGPEVTELLRIAADLRVLPDEEFRASLKSELMNRATQERQTMTTTAKHVRAEVNSLMPYLLPQNAAGLIDFMKQVFGAEEIARYPRPDGSIMHAAVRINDSVIEMGEPQGEYKPAPAALHLYVEDVDAVYQRAVEAGATTLHALVDQEYGDREASIRDPFGNNWYVATHKGPRHVPEGLRSVTPYLQVRGTPALIDFLKSSLGAVEAERHESPAGTVVHAKIRIGDSMVEMGEAHGQWKPMTGALHLYVEDVDASYKRAIEAGATSLSAPSDKPYGERSAGVVDPAGNQWYLAKHIG